MAYSFCWSSWCKGGWQGRWLCSLWYIGSVLHISAPIGKFWSNCPRHFRPRDMKFRAFEHHRQQSRPITAFAERYFALQEAQHLRAEWMDIMIPAWIDGQLQPVEKLQTQKWPNWWWSALLQLYPEFLPEKRIVAHSRLVFKHMCHFLRKIGEICSSLQLRRHYGFQTCWSRGIIIWTNNWIIHWIVQLFVCRFMCAYLCKELVLVLVLVPVFVFVLVFVFFFATSF